MTHDAVKYRGYGSPPRAWGQWARKHTPRWSTRFTPTGVGTIAASTPILPRPSVHPHGRGDNVAGEQRQRRETGSPPRAWGQLPRPSSALSLRRFTPTGVGTMRSTGYCLSSSAVHPHGRGDNQLRSSIDVAANGSPPRAWGQCALPPQNELPARFTPTGVGTMWRGRSRRDASAVHPHGRGDNGLATKDGKSKFGSPPRAWGQFRDIAQKRGSARFTPTGVGTMSEISACDRRITGSPPRAWGQCGRKEILQIERRFTPTGVGTIGYFRLVAVIVQVHPHGRGDNRERNYPVVVTAGSPPRAWGQSHSAALPMPVRRFTPTGVGTILASQAF